MLQIFGLVDHQDYLAWQVESWAVVFSSVVKILKRPVKESVWGLVVKSSFLYNQPHLLCISGHRRKVGLPQLSISEFCHSAFYIFEYFWSFHISTLVVLCSFSILSAFLATEWVEKVAAFLYFRIFCKRYFKRLVILYFNSLVVLYFWVPFT